MSGLCARMLCVLLETNSHLATNVIIVGIISLAENPAKENALLVDILLDAGAVLYCKTSKYLFNPESPSKDALESAIFHAISLMTL